MRWSLAVSHSHSRTSPHPLPVPFPTYTHSPAPLVTPYCAKPLDKTLQPFVLWLGSLCPFAVLSWLLPSVLTKTALPPQQIVMPSGIPQRVRGCLPPVPAKSTACRRDGDSAFPPSVTIGLGNVRCSGPTVSSLSPSQRPSQWHPPPMCDSSIPCLKQGHETPIFTPHFKRSPAAQSILPLQNHPRVLPTPFPRKPASGARHVPEKANPLTQFGLR
jgi:hypothetical protein